MGIKFDISIAVPGLPFDGNTLKEKSLGGSESAGLYMAKALARAGHRVNVFCNTPNGPMMDETGANYHPLEAWGMFVRGTPHDVSIVQRAPEMFAVRTAARLNLLWCHDLALGRQKQKFNSVMWNVDRVMVLSRFMAEQYETVYGIGEGALYETRNGIDVGAFTAPGRHDGNTLIYAARPERGLDVLLRDIMPKILAVRPDTQLKIAGYDNPVPHMQEFYRMCHALAAQFGDHVEWLGGLTKTDLYREYVRAGVYVYPTPSPAMKDFREVSCISAMECQAAGLPIVTTDRGALRETIAEGAGILIAEGAGYANRFADAVLGYLGSKQLREDAGSAGRERAKGLSWDALADEWVSDFEAMIRKNNDNPRRLFYHLWRQSDIMAAFEMAPDMDVRDAAVLAPFDFARKGPEGFREQYAKIGTTHEAHVFEGIPNEPRFRAMIEWLQAKRIDSLPENDRINTAIDYGCGLGGYAAYAQQNTGIEFTGVDIDQATIDICRAKSAEHGIDTAFYVGTHDALPAEVREQGFDCAVMQEVLEHVAAPWEVAQAIESRVRKDGYVYITVPYGPWEYSSYYTYPYRCHIWHFDMHDLRDMFGKKRGLSISSLAYAESQELGDILGWWVVSYRADHEPIGRIDMERKRWLQRPRQTVTATIMAGPGCEETLHWCLRSLHHVVEEVVIANCGMNEEALRMLQGYTALFPSIRVIDAPSPRTAGFETPRNLALEQVRGDFALWIDTDEKLIGTKEIQKYLRENAFHGYGIRQHHFACDTTFTPDMPVRLFRVREFKGQRLRFFGMLHEHPELELNKGPGPVVVLSDVHIAHVGYIIEQGRQARFLRNYPLLKKDMEKYPDRLLQKHFIMRDTMILVRNALQSNGGKVDGSIQAKCREVIDLAQRYFIGKGHYMNSDSLQYYSEALTVLGDGFDAVLLVDADKEQVRSQAEPIHYRFASKEDLDKEIARRVSEKTAAFEQEYY